jgi:hypothetical protein
MKSTLGINYGSKSFMAELTGRENGERREERKVKEID